MVARATCGDPVGMERQASVAVGALSGVLLGAALSACAGAVATARAPAVAESRPVRAPAAPAPADPRPALRPSHRPASLGAAAARGRLQRATAHRTLRSSHARTPAAPATLAGDRVYAEIHRRTRGLDAPLRARIAREIVSEATRAGLDPLLIVALIHVESSFDPDSVSTAGAAGLMQLREATMADVAARSRLPSTNPLDPVANIQAGVRYLARLVDAFGDPELALMAYNAGPGRIRRYLREGAVPERFRAYPESVARELDRLAGAVEGAGPARARLAMNDAPAPPRD
jgi:soluble lytic murein transglycosylase-like protein